MSKVFLATSEIGPDRKGKLSLGSPANRARFADFLTANPGIRLRIEAMTPESPKQRKYFEGAVVPFIAFFQENIDYNDADDLRRVRDWIMLEFNASYLTIGGKALKVPKTSKGELGRGLLERILDWCGEQGYPTEFLLPETYKDWNDRVRPDGGPETYLDYLVSIGKLRSSYAQEIVGE